MYVKCLGSFVLAQICTYSNYILSSSLANLVLFGYHVTTDNAVKVA